MVRRDRGKGVGLGGSGCSGRFLRGVSDVGGCKRGVGGPRRCVMVLRVFLAECLARAKRGYAGSGGSQSMCRWCPAWRMRRLRRVEERNVDHECRCVGEWGELVADRKVETACLFGLSSIMLEVGKVCAEASK